MAPTILIMYHQRHYESKHTLLVICEQLQDTLTMLRMLITQLQHEEQVPYSPRNSRILTSPHDIHCPPESPSPSSSYSCSPGGPHTPAPRPDEDEVISISSDSSMSSS